MAFLRCYDYINEQDATIPVSILNSNDLNNAQSGTHTLIDYGTWSLTKSDGSITIQSQDAAFSWDEDYAEGLLEALGIRSFGLFTGNVDILGIDYNTTYRFGFNADYTSIPYYDIEKTTNPFGDNYRLMLRQGNGNDVTLNGDGVDTRLYFAYIPYNPAMDEGCLGMIYILKGSVSGAVIQLIWSPSSEVHDAYDHEPGEEGFVPTGAHTDRKRPGIGGRGSAQKKDPEYASDTVTQPDRPNETQASAVKSGFLKSYLMTQAQLDKICSALYSDTLLDVIKSSFVNPLDFIVSLMVFPTNPDVGATENLRFGKWIASAAAGVIGALGVDITGSRLSSEFKKIDFGTLQIPENWGNFLDYSQTSIELYLPFIGSVNIDVAECMGGSINVQYTIDFFTGMCVANVLCERSFPLPSGKFIPNRAQHAYQGNCAIQIPLSAADYGSMVGSLINACTQGISNPAAGFAGIASDAIAGGLRPNISSKGNIVANSGFCSVLYPYVRITRPITAEPDSYQEVMGYPSYINTALGQCTGLCICDEIDLKGVTGATEEELNRIRQLCKDGVYV